jgi:hypothetical protein
MKVYWIQTFDTQLEGSQFDTPELYADREYAEIKCEERNELAPEEEKPAEVVELEVIQTPSPADEEENKRRFLESLKAEQPK